MTQDMPTDRTLDKMPTGEMKMPDPMMMPMMMDTQLNRLICLRSSTRTEGELLTVGEVDEQEEEAVAHDALDTPCGRVAPTRCDMVVGWKQC